jgi:hypothetical protein
MGGKSQLIGSVHKSTPPAHRTWLFRPTTALPTPPVGLPASPWVWTKARSKLGALIRLCGDGAMSNEATMPLLGSFYTEKSSTPPAHRTWLFRPTTALPTPPVGLPASPWVWTKARSKLGALIRLCGDGAMSNEATMGSFHTERSTPPAHRTWLFRPTTALPTPPLGHRLDHERQPRRRRDFYFCAFCCRLFPGTKITQILPGMFC